MNISIPDFSKAHILIIGDIMLDRYLSGPVSRISPEAPVPVIKVDHEEERPGGAGNVALNIAALGAKVTLLGITGEDREAYVLEQFLKSAQVECHFQHVAGVPTISKLRALSQHQQLLRLDFEKEFDECFSRHLLKMLPSHLDEIDLIVLSDYGKGTLACSRELIQKAEEYDIPVFVDPKGVDFSSYQEATLITPNFKEFLAVVGPCADEQEIANKAQKLLQDYALQALLVTRGEHGMSLFCKGEPELHIPTRAQEVFDVTGAGDTVIATFATAIATGMELSEAVKLSNVAAGIVVGKLGAATVSMPELRRATQKTHLGGVLNEEQLMLAVADAHAHGEKVVMTNGCFDILHAGHVACLEEAKALGDRLIVAVNDDASVQALKGEGRPINSVEKRMAVLSGLGSVDWVLPFSEETPKRLICRVLPDVLVKGGDWRPDQIAGSDCVLKNGGQVLSLGFVEGHSTTSVIEKINYKGEQE